jgi:hypothetical protein
MGSKNKTKMQKINLGLMKVGNIRVLIGWTVQPCIETASKELIRGLGVWGKKASPNNFYKAVSSLSRVTHQHP